MKTRADRTARPTILVVGEAITAFMHYPTDAPLAFHGPFPSGAPVIFASAAARLGAHVELAAGVGDDMFGLQFRERLASHGMSTRCLVVDPRAPTAAVFVTYEADGSRTFMFHLEGTAALRVDAAALDRATPADWLHVSGATLWFGGRRARRPGWRSSARSRRAPRSPSIRTSGPPSCLRRRAASSTSSWAPLRSSSRRRGARGARRIRDGDPRAGRGGLLQGRRRQVPSWRHLPADGRCPRPA